MIRFDHPSTYTFDEVAAQIGASRNQVVRAVIELERDYIIEELRLVPWRAAGKRERSFTTEDVSKIQRFLEMRSNRPHRRVRPPAGQQTMSP